MKLRPEHEAVLEQLLERSQAGLAELVAAAGLDRSTDLIGGNFRGAAFGDSDLAGFNLSRADLRGADLSRARGVDRAMFADVIQDHHTRWPERRQPVPGSVMQDRPDCPELILLPPGSFLMGIPEAESKREKSQSIDGRSRPQHEVAFRNGFWLAKYPVTRGEFAAFVADTGHDMSGSAFGFVRGKGYERSEEANWRNPGFEQTDRDPVVCVNGLDADAYVAWLSRKTGRRYRLPSEAEWEYAARAGTTTARFWGDSWRQAKTYARVEGEGTAPVGSLKPNQFGLHDMLSNVWEWVADPWHDSYANAPEDGSVWVEGGDESRRVLRGGSWGSNPRDVRAGVRCDGSTGIRGSDVGFRVARTL